MQARFGQNGPVVEQFGGVGRPDVGSGSVLGCDVYYICGHVSGSVEDLTGGFDVVV
jgi:hypothetical protein